MNKKYLVYSILTASLFVSSLSFSMHSLIFRGVQVISGGYCIGKGFGEAYKRERGMKNHELSNRNYTIPTDHPVHEFVAHEAKRLNVAKPSLYYEYYYRGWSSVRHGLYVPSDFCQHLILKKRLERTLNERKNLILDDPHFFDVSNYLDDEIQRYQNEIHAYEAKSCNRFDLYHELAHQTNDDANWRTYAHAISSLAVQAAGSSITYTSNKLSGIKSPRTILQLLSRSSFAVGTIPLKIALAYGGESFYNRYQEWRADTYACKNADQKELDAASNRFQNCSIQWNKMILTDPDRVLLANAEGIFKDNKIIVGMVSKQLRDRNIKADEDSALLKIAQFIYDPKHPYGKDRADFIKKHMQKEDQDHPEVKN